MGSESDDAQFDASRDGSPNEGVAESSLVDVPVGLREEGEKPRAPEQAARRGSRR